MVASGKDLPALKCRLCGEITPMQSNLAIAEELLRISDYMEPVLPRCPNEACALSTAPLAPENVTHFGTNAHGTPRFKCVGCRKALAFGGRSTKRQRRTSPNRDILQHLMNAMPLRRIIKVLGISPNQLYDRIDFLYEQAQMAEAHGVDLEAAELLLAREELDKAASFGKWGDRWFKHPVSDMREPEKSVCWLTDIDPVKTDPTERKHQLSHHALLHLKATLTAVDRFFMQVRRGLTLAERAVASSNTDKRLWHGKSAYNPEVLVKVLGIFRTYFNYCEVGQDGMTPAMRLGLAKGPIAPEDIVYFTPAPPPRKRLPGTRKAQGVDVADPSTAGISLATA